MATIINNPPEHVVEIDRTDTSGWDVAVIVLLIVIAVGGYAWYHYYPSTTPAAVPNNTSTNINVTLPPSTASSTAP